MSIFSSDNSVGTAHNRKDIILKSDERPEWFFNRQGRISDEMLLFRLLSTARRSDGTKVSIRHPVLSTWCNKTKEEKSWIVIATQIVLFSVLLPSANIIAVVKTTVLSDRCRSEHMKLIRRLKNVLTACPLTKNKADGCGKPQPSQTVDKGPNRQNEI